MGDGVGTLIEAARTLDETDDDYEVLIVGDGAERAELKALARQWGLRSVTFAGRMPRERLPELLATADVTVATERDRPLLAGALSIKVLEYMAAARPVVASGWTAEVIVSAEAGIACAGAAGGTRRGDRQSDCGPWPSASHGAQRASLRRSAPHRRMAVERLERALRSMLREGPVDGRRRLLRSRGAQSRG